MARTAIVGREKPTKKVKAPRVAKKKGRPAKGEIRPMKRLRSGSRAEKSAMFRSSSETREAKTIIPMAPHEAVSYNERTAVERCNGRLKDEFGDGCVQVRGADKEMLYLKFGIILLFADQLLKVIGC